MCVGMVIGRGKRDRNVSALWHRRLPARTLVHVQQALPRFSRLLLGIGRQIALNRCKNNSGEMRDAAVRIIG